MKRALSNGWVVVWETTDKTPSYLLDLNGEKIPPTTRLTRSLRGELTAMNRWWNNACKHALASEAVKEAFYLYMTGVLCQVDGTFCRYENGRYINIYGDELEVDEEHMYVYANIPDYLKEERRQWLEHFSDHKIIPVFPEQFEG